MEENNMIVDVSNVEGQIRLSDDLSVPSIFTDIMKMTNGQERFRMHHVIAHSCQNVSFAYCMKKSQKKDVIHYEKDALDTTLQTRIEEEKNGANWLFYRDQHGLPHLTDATRKLLKDILEGVIDILGKGCTHGNISNLTNIIVKRADGYTKLKNMSNKKKADEDVDGLATVVNSLYEVGNVELLNQYRTQLKNISSRYKFLAATNVGRADQFLRNALLFLKNTHPVFKDYVGKLDFILLMQRRKRKTQTYVSEINKNLKISAADKILENAIPDGMFKDTYNDEEKKRWNPDDNTKWVGFRKTDVLDFFRNRIEHMNDQTYLTASNKGVEEKVLYHKINSLEPCLLGELYDLEYRLTFKIPL